MWKLYGFVFVVLMGAISLKVCTQRVEWQGWHKAPSSQNYLSPVQKSFSKVCKGSHTWHAWEG